MKKVLVSLALVLALLLGCVSMSVADDLPVGYDAGTVDNRPNPDNWPYEEIPSGSIIAYGDLYSVTTLDGHAVSVDDTLWDSFQYFKKPTCTEYGYAYYKCEDPVHKKENGMHVAVINVTPHEWTYVDDKGVYVAPDCTNPGKGRWICSVCGKIGDSYEIMPNGHTFTGKSYDVIFAPSCTEVGYGVVTCDVCGARQTTVVPKTREEAAAAAYKWDATNKVYIDNEKHWVLIQKVAHQYTDWLYAQEADCWFGGKASRTCIKCGDIQYVDENTTLWQDVHGNVLQNKQNLTDVMLRKLAKVEKVNNKYKAEAIPLLDNLTFNNLQDVQKVVDYLKLKKGVDLELKSNEELDCYNRVLTFVCPYCKSGRHPFTGVIAHPAITVYVLEPSHVWKALPEPAVKSEYTWLNDYYAAKGKDSDVNEYVRNYALAKMSSVKPTCEMPGISLYLCKYFDKNPAHGKDVTMPDGTVTKDGVKTVLVPATGHDWSAWITTKTYMKDGKEYSVQYRICNVCKKQEHRTWDGVTATDDISDTPDFNVPKTALEQFVERCYKEALGRASDQEGFKNWVTALESKQLTAQQVSYGFIFSPEMNAATKIKADPDSLLKSMYALYLGREPDPEGLAYWKQRIADGLTLEQLDYGFAQSVEFKGIVKSFGLE